MINDGTMFLFIFLTDHKHTEILYSFFMCLWSVDSFSASDERSSPIVFVKKVLIFKESKYYNNTFRKRGSNEINSLTIIINIKNNRKVPCLSPSRLLWMTKTCQSAGVNVGSFSHPGVDNSLLGRA